MKNSKKNEYGMLTVEATLAFVPFLMVIIGIISFINIFMVHNRIQYAIFQAGSELSAYTYLYQALNFRTAEGQFQEDANMAKEDLNKLTENISGFIGNMKKTEESYVTVIRSDLNNLEGNVNAAVEQTKQTVESGKNTVNHVINNPIEILQGMVMDIIQKGLEGLKSLFTDLVVGGMANVYIQTDTMSAQQYLKKFGVVDGKLDYSKSIMFGDEDLRMIDIIVEYDIEVFMFKLIKKDPTIHMVQRCTIPAWLDGDGRYYEEIRNGE